jgi:hypothetical protein
MFSLGGVVVESFKLWPHFTDPDFYLNRSSRLHSEDKKRKPVIKFLLDKKGGI